MATKSRFKVPLQSEVEAYMKEKMGWPDGFCRAYAEKFWNHYQASGWKLSNGNAMKDWKAAFNSQWQRPKFNDDIEMLQKELKKKTGTTDEGSKHLLAVDQLLMKYKDHPTSVKFEDFGKHYDFLKEKNLLVELDRPAKLQLMEAYAGDVYKCKCAVVQKTFEGYVNNFLTVSKILELRNRLANGTVVQ